jgi:uncharacterized protein (DUF433 family)
MATLPSGKKIVRRHQVSVVGIVTWISAGLSGFQISAEQETFVNCAQQFCAPNASHQMFTEFLSLEVKRSDRETDHSPLTIADIKNEWRYNLHHLYAIMSLTWKSLLKLHHEAENQFIT